MKSSFAAKIELFKQALTEIGTFAVPFLVGKVIRTLKIQVEIVKVIDVSSWALNF